jgi:dGTPase
MGRRKEPAMSGPRARRRSATGTPVVPPQRADRFQLPHHLEEPRPDDPRSPFAHDRDRVVYSSALRRLAGVTQVVDPKEGHVFHNRLTHTLKVAQIARRLAERWCKTKEAKALGGIEPEVVEAAALIHDLGHPPFGHIAEKALDDLVKAAGDSDGYEGNAQSFRIVTKLAVRDARYPGLNLTRATLNAVLKYPWFRETGGTHYEKKFGAYRSEQAEFEFARALGRPGDKQKSVEAALMDWADGIAYAVHDLEDFYRAGLVPLDRLSASENEQRRWLEQALEKKPLSGYAPREVAAALEDLLELSPVREAYRGSKRHRALLRMFTGLLIDRYMRGLRLRTGADDEGGWQVESVGDGEVSVEIDSALHVELEVLKQLTWGFVIDNPALATQQYGKERVIRDLFDTFLEAAAEGNWAAVLPVRAAEQLTLTELPAEPGKRAICARVVADLISSLSDSEALLVHRRLSGADAGSVLDPLPR